MLVLKLFILFVVVVFSSLFLAVENALAYEMASLGTSPLVWGASCL